MRAVLLALEFLAVVFVALNVTGYALSSFGMPKESWGQDVTGRTTYAWTSKINPVWWFRRDGEQKVTDADAAWYMPGKPEWLRWLMWNVVRNPLRNNFFNYVLGVADRNYALVAGPAAPLTVQLNDLSPPQKGFQRAVIKLGLLRLPFVSYSGDKVVWYFGWQPSGTLAAKFTRG